MILGAKGSGLGSRGALLGSAGAGALVVSAPILASAYATNVATATAYPTNVASAIASEDED